jgi:hypothetical protein
MPGGEDLPTVVEAVALPMWVGAAGQTEAVVVPLLISIEVVAGATEAAVLLTVTGPMAAVLLIVGNFSDRQTKP